MIEKDKTKIVHRICHAIDRISYGRSARTISMFFAAGCIFLAGCFIVIPKPKLNWDLVPYIAVAESYYSDDIGQVHASTFDRLKSRYSDVFRDRFLNSAYKRAVADEPRYLQDQLPFYDVKPLYPGLIAGAMLVGIDPIDAAIWISRLAMIGVLLLSFQWARTSLPVHQAAALAFVLTSSPFAFQFAAWQTPDPLFALLLMTFVFLLARKGKTHLWTALPVVPLLIACRPDSVLLVLGFSLILMGAIHGAWRLAIAVNVASIAQYLLQSYVSGNAGWVALFHHTYNEKILQLDQFAPAYGLSDYLRVYAGRVFDESNAGLWVILVICALFLSSYLRYARYDLVRYVSIVILTGYCIAHWVLVPSQKDRLLAGAFMCLVLVMVLVIADRRRADMRRTPEKPR